MKKILIWLWYGFVIAVSLYSLAIVIMSGEGP